MATDQDKKLAKLESELKQTNFSFDAQRRELQQLKRDQACFQRAEEKARAEFQAFVLDKLAAISTNVSEELAKVALDNKAILTLYRESESAVVVGRSLANLLAGSTQGLDTGNCRGPRREHERIENS